MDGHDRENGGIASGGWGALKATANSLLREHIPVKGTRTLLKANQPEGFDCPGCAWPDPKPESSVKFCEQGAKAVAWEATARRVTPEFLAAHTVTWLRGQGDHYLESVGRLTHPMVYDRDSDTYRPIAWGDAFSLIGRHLRQLDHPDQALFYTSGRTSNEAAFLWQLFARAFGTNNMPDCSNMCHEASGEALKESIGTGKGTVSLADFEQADAIFMFGQNPATNHPRMLGDLRKAAKRGCRIVTINPLRERGLERFRDPKEPAEMLLGSSTTLTHLYLQPKVGGDLAVLKGIMKHVLEMDRAARSSGRPPLLDDAFIAEHTDGFQAFASDLAAEEWELIETESGLSREDMLRAARIYVEAKAVICSWAMGLTQHEHGVETIQQIVNLQLLRGNIGRPGAGVCPVRGHSNVQGDRSVGITEKPTEEIISGLDRLFGITVPRRHGHATVAAIQAMHRGECKVLLCLGGNFVAAAPDSAYTEEAVSRCDLTVHISTKLNRSHVVPGKAALILPALGRTEMDTQGGQRQSVSVEDSMSMVHASSGMNHPASAHLLSEPAIVAGIANATLPNGGIDWGWYVEDYDRIRDAVQHTIAAFRDYNARIRTPGGFHLGNAAAERRWATATGKARFVVGAIPRFWSDPQRVRHEGRPVFRLITFRSHDQYNTTVYGLDDRYRGIKGRRDVVFMNADDIAALGLAGEARIGLRTVSTDGRERRMAGLSIVPYDLPRGCLAAYYPETNVLTPIYAHGVRSGTPAYKSVSVTIEPV